MKVTQVAIRPTEASEAATRPALTPELLAASGARYSRNNAGLEAILERIDPANLDKSVDSIFRLIDYGHQSIADMAPVAMFMDGMSLWLAYYVWTLCPTAGGQESSTRYIRLCEDELLSAGVLGIPAELRQDWEAGTTACFAAYADAVAMWEALAREQPDLTRIPPALLADNSERARNKTARMRRNYGFDRARYFLPAAAPTNVMLVMSARAWASLCQHLCSHLVPEARSLGDAIRGELALCAPRLMKHAVAKDSIANGIAAEFTDLSKRAAAGQPQWLQSGSTGTACPSTASLEVTAPPSGGGSAFAADLRFHENRYAWFGGELRRTAVRFSWKAMAMAEIRDLNRHRTGNKHCPLQPMGFYSALDSLPGDADCRDALAALNERGRQMSARAHDLLAAGDPTYIYWTLLGTQYPFEHLTTADKFIYEAELRTGTGAHFQYARHLHDALALWYELYPETRGLVLEGSAEPE
jgi:thymidylate synthase ThyX